MKVGAVGLGNRAAHVFFELKKINPNYSLVAFVDPQPIGKKFAEEKSIFPNQEYSSLEEISSIKLEGMHCIIIPSNPHEMELLALNRWKVE